LQKNNLFKNSQKISYFSLTFFAQTLAETRSKTAGMPDCAASYQSGTGLKKTNDAGNNPVPEYNDAVRHFIGPVPD
jgi:hypothetical protein